MVEQNEGGLWHCMFYKLYELGDGICRDASLFFFGLVGQPKTHKNELNLPSIS
jgi:hypothetical protein